jgi:hypothetical protein
VVILNIFVTYSIEHPQFLAKANDPNIIFSKKLKYFLINPIEMGHFEWL